MGVWRTIDRINRGIGEWVSWLNVVLVVMIAIDVIGRYLFNITKTWVLELEWQLFATIFLLGSAYTLSVDRHVRVDVIFVKLSPRTQALINALGYVFLLIPWSLLVVIKASRYVHHAWVTMEGSPNPGGLPYYFIIKSIILLAFLLLLLQGVAQGLLEFRKWREWRT